MHPIYNIAIIINFSYALGMNGRQIEIFHAVIRAGTITGAAERLGITQPAVSTSLKQIEANLGFPLFCRSGGRLQPTAEALVLRNEAERIHDSLDVFKRLAAQLKQNMASHLRVANPPAFSHQIAPEAISDFVLKAKDCTIDVATLHHDQILADLSRSAGDNKIAITFGQIDQPGISATVIGWAQIVALAPAGSPFADRDVIAIDELASLPLIGTFAGEPLGNIIDGLMREPGRRANYVARVQNHSMAASLTSRGVGACIIDSVTAAYARSRHDEASFRMMAIAQAPNLPIAVLRSHGHALNRHAKLFIELFRKRMRQYLPELIDRRVEKMT